MGFKVFSGRGAEALSQWRAAITARQSRVALNACAEMALLGRDEQGRRIRNMTGGLGIVMAEQASADAHPQMRTDDLRAAFVTLAHLDGRGDQKIARGGQEMVPAPWALGSSRFLPLGTVEVEVKARETTPVQLYLDAHFLQTGDGDGTPVILADSTETRGFYPRAETTEALRFQLVLGRAAFLAGEELDLFEGDDPAGVLVNNDCHGAFASWHLLQRHLGRLSWEAALHATRRSGITTVHAPQPIDYHYGYDVLATAFTPEQVGRLFQLGSHNGKFSSLTLAMELSYGITFVSPSHYRLSLDPANGLVPYHLLGRRKFAVTSNVVNPLNWMDAEQAALMERVCPSWVVDPDSFTSEQQARLLFNDEFRHGFIELQEKRRGELRTLLAENGISVPEDAIIIGAMRRATAYKLNLLIDLLEKRMNQLEETANRYGPVLLLFGGLAPDHDGDSATALGRLLGLIDRINQKGNPNFRAAFFPNYNEYNSPIILRGSDIWAMFSDPLTPDVTKKEAFGPSGAKVSQLGGLLLGGSDGWSPDFNLNGAGVTVFGAKTETHGHDAGRALRKRMRNPAVLEAERETTADDFVYYLGNLLCTARTERNLVAQGEGHLSPAFHQRAAAIVNGFGNFHPRRIQSALGRLIAEIRAMSPERT